MVLASIMQRYLLFTRWTGKRAPCHKTAPFRRINGTCYLPLDKFYFPFLLLGAGNRYSGEQGLCIGMKRTHKNLISAPHLNALTKIHHHNRIGEMVHDAEIVGDKNISQPHFFLKVQQKIQNLSLNRNIQGGNRFVANNKLGIYRYCSGNSNPLQS